MAATRPTCEFRQLGSLLAAHRASGAQVLGVTVLGVAGLWLNRTTTDSGDFQGGLDVLAPLAPMPLAWLCCATPRTPSRSSPWSRQGLPAGHPYSAATVACRSGRCREIRQWGP